MKYDINVIFYLVDEFSKIYSNWQKYKLIEHKIEGKKVRNRAGKMSLSEMLSIMIIYHLSFHGDFKSFYLYFLKARYSKEFPELISYNRFIELMPGLLVPLILFFHCLSGKKENIYFIDSTKLQICHNKRTGSNRVFKGLAEMGRSSYGWFMGFKLHLVINSKGQIIAVKITRGNIDDRNPAEQLTEGLEGNLYADKGYISNKLFKKLFTQGLKIITGIKSNMKNYLLNIQDKIYLRKRSVIESVFNILKNRMNLEHTRHRSPINFLVNIISCLVAYQLKTNKPKIKEDNHQEFFMERLLEFKERIC